MRTHETTARRASGSGRTVVWMGVMVGPRGSVHTTTRQADPFPELPDGCLIALQLGATFKFGARGWSTPVAMVKVLSWCGVGWGGGKDPSVGLPTEEAGHRGSKGLQNLTIGFRSWL